MKEKMDYLSLSGFISSAPRLTSLRELVEQYKNSLGISAAGAIAKMQESERASLAGIGDLAKANFSSLTSRRDLVEQYKNSLGISAADAIAKMQESEREREFERELEKYKRAFGFVPEWAGKTKNTAAVAPSRAPVGTDAITLIRADDYEEMRRLLAIKDGKKGLAPPFEIPEEMQKELEKNYRREFARKASQAKQSPYEKAGTIAGVNELLDEKKNLLSERGGKAKLNRMILDLIAEGKIPAPNTPAPKTVDAWIDKFKNAKIN